MPKQPLVVLMVEDNEHDILATQRAWRTHHIAHPLYIVTDGEACLSYLHQRGSYSAPGIAPIQDSCSSTSIYPRSMASVS